MSFQRTHFNFYQSASSSFKNFIYNEIKISSQHDSSKSLILQGFSLHDSKKERPHERISPFIRSQLHLLFIELGGALFLK